MLCLQGCRKKVLFFMAYRGASETFRKCIFPKCLLHQINPVLLLLLMLGDRSETGGIAVSQEMGTTALAKGTEQLVWLV